MTVGHDGGQGAVSDRGRGGLLPPGQRGDEEVLLTLTRPGARAPVLQHHPITDQVHAGGGHCEQRHLVSVSHLSRPVLLQCLHSVSKHSQLS